MFPEGVGYPPYTIISVPVQTAAASALPMGALAMLVDVQVSSAQLGVGVGVANKVPLKIEETPTKIINVDNPKPIF